MTLDTHKKMMWVSCELAYVLNILKDTLTFWHECIVILDNTEWFNSKATHGGYTEVTGLSLTSATQFSEQN